MNEVSRKYKLPDLNDLKIDTKRFNCLRCGFEIQIPFQSGESRLYEKSQEHINDLYNGYDALINELQNFFPQTPIKEYFEMKQGELFKCLELLMKRLGNQLSEAEEIELENNFWINKIKK